MKALSGGASRHTYAVTVDVGSGDPLDLVFQGSRHGAVSLSLAPTAEARLVEAAATSGVRVPIVHAAHRGSEGEWVLYRRVGGDTLPRRVLSDPRLHSARRRLVADVGESIGRVQRIDTGLLDQPTNDPLDQLAALSESLGEPHPAFEIGMRRLAAIRFAPRPPVVVHGDLRMGNLIVDESGLAAVIDWELAHVGDPVEDLGWFCVRAWRFGSDLPAGGLGTRQELLDAYSAVSGLAIPVDELIWWEAYGTLRWGLICVVQAKAHLDGHTRSVELAAIGRRAAQCEWDLLSLVDRLESAS